MNRASKQGPALRVKPVLMIAALIFALFTPSWGAAQGPSLSLPLTMPPSSADNSGQPDPVSSTLPGNISIDFGSGEDQNVKITTGIKILLLMTVLALAPSIMIMLTSFLRIVIVLSFIKRALGLQSVPPPQILAGLAVFLTIFVMMPTLIQIKTEALDPFMSQKIDEKTALAQAQAPIREFMFDQTRNKDLTLFLGIAKIERPETRGDVPTYVLIPSFIISELKTAFIIGFVIYIPFLVIDMVIACILLSMGMMMLPPVIISLPFKIILFVLVDGWNLIVGSLIASFVT